MVFCSKLVLSLSLAIALFILYIFLLKFFLPTTDANNGIIKGFAYITIIPLFITWITVHCIFRKNISEYEGYYRLWADFIAVLSPIVIMYQTYYASQVHLDIPEDSIIIIMLSNKGLLGIPYVILLIRFFIAIYSLVERENKEMLG